MEVQHVITMLVGTGYLDDVRWAQATLTSVLHLGYYLNDRRILWSIPAGLNRLKKCIPLRNWYQQGAWMVGKVNHLEATIAQKDFVREYLLAYATEGRPHAVHRALGPQRRNIGLPETELTWLTRAAGMEIFNLLTGWCDSLGIDKQFSVRAQRVSNPEASIADLYSHERESWRAKRSLLKMKAAKGKRLFVSDADKVRYTYDFDTGTKHYSYNNNVQTYMSKNIWEIREMKDTTFWPRENIDMKERMADTCMLDLAGSGKAIDAPEANINSDMTDCLGGGGVYGSPEAFMTLLHAVLNNDSGTLIRRAIQTAVGRALQIITPKSPALRPADARIRWSEYSNFRAEKFGVLLASYQQTSIRVG